ncbi:hypothetical protein [Thermicanus aegyptius]|uniref:hypothetical protein n=1 Tax=Thermicanus aegyptius TaxID=94009 RepID=UPI000409FB5E|nr:hypothetical protein [Thermicanus aegyptius]
MRTIEVKIEVKIFRYEELSEKAKNRARNLYREWGLNYEPQIITEYMEEVLNDLGYGGVEVYWRLSHSQGDGVAFYGKLNDPDKLLKRLLTEKEFRRWERISKASGVEIRINRIGSYYNHYNTMEVVVDSDRLYQDDYPFVSIFLKKIEQKIQADVKEVSKKLEEYGYKELEYQESDEYIDMLLDQEEFLADGRRWVS